MTHNKAQTAPTLDRQMLDKLAVGLVRWMRSDGETDSLLDYANPAWFRLTGVDPSSLGQRLNPVDLVHPEDREEYLRLISASPQSESTVSWRVRYLRQDGSVVWVRGNSSGFRVGALTYRSATLEDESALVKSERQNSLFEAELHAQASQLAAAKNQAFEQMRSVLERSTTAFSLYRHDGSWVWSNLAAEINSGLSPQRRAELNVFSSPVHQRAGLTAAAQAVLRSGLPQKISVLTMGSSGKHLDLEVNLSRITLDGQDMFLIESKDLHEQHALNEQLKLERDTAQTERLKAEALSQQLRMYNEALERFLIVSRWDEEGRIVYANDAFLQFTGYSREELMGQFRGLVRHPNTTRAEVEALEQGLQQKGFHQCRWMNQTKDGDTRWSQLSAVVLPPNAQGRVETLVLSVDLTPLQLRENHIRQLLGESSSRSEKLAHTQRELQTVMDTAQVGLMRIRHRAVVWANRQAGAIFGYAGHDMVNMSLHDLYANEGVAESTEEQAVAQSMQAKNSFVVISKARTRTGDERILEAKGVYFDLETLDAIVALRDITEEMAHQEQLESALSQTEQAQREMRELLNAQESSAAILTPDRTVLACNQAYASMFGQTVETLVNRNINDFEGPMVAQERAPLVARVLAGEVVRFEGRVIRDPGQERYLSLVYSPRRNDRGAIVGYISCFIDITEAKQRELRLIEVSEQAQAANVAKQQFLATISHELRTPLNGIMGAFEMLQRKQLDPLGKKLADAGMQSSQLLLRIVSDVLDFSKIDEGHLDLDPQPNELPQVLQGIEGLLQAVPREAGVRLVVEVGAGLDAMVLVDEVRLSQILMNLGSNALKFTHQGQIHLRAECLAVDTEALDVRFSVQDSGIGMNEATLAKLFSPFTQADSSHTRKYGGTGLGLSIAQRLAQAMGSQIEVQSELGQGSTFSLRLRLPLHTLGTAQDERALLDALPLQGLRILVVDDVATNRLSLVYKLQAAGAEVAEEIDGAKALQRLEQQEDDAAPFDLVFMDIQMPFMDGLQATRRIRQHAKPQLRTLPVVAVTGNVTESMKNEALASGMNAVLHKPVLTRDVVASALSLCGQEKIARAG